DGREDALSQVRRTSDRFDLLFLLLIAGLAFTALSVFALYVIPRFQLIFLDFDIQWPVVTEMIFAVSSSLSSAPMVAAYAAWLTGVVLLLVALIRSRGLETGGWCSAVLWRLPLGRQLLRDRDLSDVCQVMALGVRAGLPLGTTIKEAESLRLSRGFRAQLERWGRAVEAGEPVEAAAATANLPPTAVGLLATAQTAGNLAATLHFLSDHYRQRFSRLRALVVGSLVPLVTLGLGVIVATLAVGLIFPMTQLIDRFAAAWGGG
ncbi:MAG: type II secretion system F family protein, partial [Phycisphaerae bacterium]|nr:type II secretion system F family protein [Phycisphaerae bacterium]